MKRWSIVASPGLFRLLLALTVFLHHLSRLAIGAAAVYIFFILSGYWIATMWRDKYSRTRHRYMTFIISRVWRVLPVYLVCSALSWLILYIRHGPVPIHDSLIHQVVANTLMVGYRSLSLQANVPAWSLDVEVQFYVVAPLIILSLRRTRWAFLVWAGAAALAVAVDDGLSLAPYLLFFVIGIMASIKSWRPAASLAIASVGATTLILAVLVAGPWRGIVLAGTHVTAAYAFNPVACTLLALTMAPFALFTTAQHSSSVDALWGEFSFIVYLLHFPVLDLIGTGGGSYLTRSGAMLNVVLVVAACTVGLYVLVDRPLNRLRAQWVRGQLTRKDVRDEVVVV